MIIQERTETKRICLFLSTGWYLLILSYIQSLGTGAWRHNQVLDASFVRHSSCMVIVMTVQTSLPVKAYFIGPPRFISRFSRGSWIQYIRAHTHSESLSLFGLTLSSEPSPYSAGIVHTSDLALKPLSPKNSLPKPPMHIEQVREYERHVSAP